MAQWSRNLLLFQSSRVQFPASMPGGPQLFITPVLGNLMPSFGLHGYPYILGTYTYTNKNKSWKKKKSMG